MKRPTTLQTLALAVALATLPIASFADDPDLGEFPYVDRENIDNYEWLADLAEQHLNIDAFAPADEAA